EPCVAQMPQPERDRVRIGARAKFVHKALMRESILDAQRRAQRPGKKWRRNRVGKYALASHRPRAVALAIHASGNVRRSGVAAVAELIARFRRGPRLYLFRRIAEQHAADNVSRTVITGPSTF